VLSAHSLTHLHLVLQEGAAGKLYPAELRQLARLSSLQQLHLQGSSLTFELPAGCLAGLAQLSRLTSLRLSGLLYGIMQELQQLLMQSLPLCLLNQSIWTVRIAKPLVIP
jgi:uncharacterized membrane protein